MTRCSVRTQKAHAQKFLPLDDGGLDRVWRGAQSSRHESMQHHNVPRPHGTQRVPRKRNLGGKIFSQPKLVNGFAFHQISQGSRVGFVCRQSLRRGSRGGLKTTFLVDWMKGLAAARIVSTELADWPHEPGTVHSVEGIFETGQSGRRMNSGMVIVLGKKCGTISSRKYRGNPDYS